MTDARRIKADPARIYEISGKMASYSSKLQDLQSQLQAVSSRLDWEVSSKQGINTRFSKAIKNMATQQKKADSFRKLIQGVCDGMNATDEALSQQSKGLLYRMEAIKVRSEVLPAALTVPDYPSNSIVPNVSPVPVADLTLVKHHAGSI